MRGYTLIELLVVLALMALLTALVLPRVQVLYSGVERAEERDQVVQAIAGLGYLALTSGQPFELDNYPDDWSGPRLAIPDGWTLKAAPPIRYNANGVCSGGVVALSNGDYRDRLSLEPPFCRI